MGDDPEATTYGEKSEDWRPFADRLDWTVGQSTQVALIQAGQRGAEYCPIALSDDLLAKVKKARESNSIVLVVLDQASLRFDVIRKALSDYDGYDATHVGLVTAGGNLKDKERLSEVFPVKFLGRSYRPHHLWTVPQSSTDYERSVMQLSSALRADIQRNAK